MRLLLLLLFATLYLLAYPLSDGNGDSSSERKHSDNNDKSQKIRHNRKGKLRLALCLTGQISRLEILSKLRHFVIANILIGHRVDVFVNLDDGDVKQTMWNFDYSNNPYTDLNSTELEKVVLDSYRNMILKYKFRNSNNWNDSRSANSSFNHQWKRLTQGLGLQVKVQPPLRSNFSLRGNAPPVTNKTLTIKKSELSANLHPIEQSTIPSASSSSGGKKANESNEGDDEVKLYVSELARWQNHMRWMNALRECVMDVQASELRSRVFYDVVVRMREDSYLLGPVLIRPDHTKYLTSANFNVFFGVNDHTIIVGRQFADPVFRGIIEDYYLNESLDVFSWGNPERRIWKVATTKGVEVVEDTPCNLPVVTLRGRHNASHWRLHTDYSRGYRDACIAGSEEGSCRCRAGYMRTLDSNVAPLEV